MVRKREGIFAKLVKKLILIWDPDFTKVTPKERRALDQADAELESGIFCTSYEVWGD